jgi:beta-1,4-mannosyl-glycoprotein beta-1,4-N-acetylglucosaminyltransferase
MRKIYDCFQFFNELDLLEIRLELLYDHVDYFVISETNRTHSNNEKPLYFEENKHLFSKYLDKIIHIKEDLPIDILSPIKKEESSKYNIQFNKIIDIFNREDENGLKSYPTFARDYIQREFNKLGLIDCNEDDIILVSDLDEIPHPDIISKIKNDNLINHVVMMDCHNFYVNNICHTNWYGTTSFRYSDLENISLTHFRTACKGNNFIKIFNGGWHLSYVGGIDRIKQKIQGYSHQEYNHNGVLSSIESKINSNSDLFGRRNNTYSDTLQEYFFDNMKKIDIETYTYPKNIVDLIKIKFPYLIKNDD